MPVVSNTKPTLGRVVHVYAARQWSGPRAGIVAMAWPDSGCANVNLQLDGCTDAQLLSFMRASPQGTTLPSIPVFDPLTDEERKAITLDYWAEWMPFQVSQQQAEIPKRLTALEDRVSQAAEWGEKVEGLEGRLAEAESKLGTLLTQFAEELRNIPGGAAMNFPPVKFSLADMTRSNHEKWLAGGDRSYSPYNRPWNQLSVKERREISRTVQNTFGIVAPVMQVPCQLVDDFDAEAAAAVSAANKPEAAAKGSET